jgi:hypothetical protein
MSFAGVSSSSSSIQYPRDRSSTSISQVDAPGFLSFGKFMPVMRARFCGGSIVLVLPCRTPSPLVSSIFLFFEHVSPPHIFKPPNCVTLKLIRRGDIGCPIAPTFHAAFLCDKLKILVNLRIRQPPSFPFGFFYLLGHSFLN